MSRAGARPKGQAPPVTDTWKIRVREAMRAKGLNNSSLAAAVKKRTGVGTDVSVRELLLTKQECARMEPPQKAVENSRIAPTISDIVGVPLPATSDERMQQFMELGSFARDVYPVFFDEVYRALMAQFERHKDVLKLSDPLPYEPQARGNDAAPTPRRRRKQ